MPIPSPLVLLLLGVGIFFWLRGRSVPTLTLPDRHTPATLIFLTANLGMFGAIALRGGINHPAILIALGGMVPEAIARGEWWRLLIAPWLHFTPWHLIANLLALGLCGPWVEKQMGAPRYALGYLLIGPLVLGLIALASLRLSAYLHPPLPWYLQPLEELGDPGQLWIGASVAILGVLGMMAAQLQHRRQKFALYGLLALISAQLVGDLANPQVSFLSHLLGFGGGWLYGSLGRFPLPPKNEENIPSGEG